MKSDKSNFHRNLSCSNVTFPTEKISVINTDTLSSVYANVRYVDVALDNNFCWLSEILWLAQNEKPLLYREDQRNCKTTLQLRHVLKMLLFFSFQKTRHQQQNNNQFNFMYVQHTSIRLNVVNYTII